MSYSQWADFVYYKLGDIAMFGSTTYQALQANINVVPTGLAPNWQVLPAPSGAGVSSLETLTGAITMSCSAGTYTTAGNDIGLTIAFPVPPPAPTTSYGSFYSSTTQALANGLETILTYDAKSVGSPDITPSGAFPATGIVVADAGVYKFLFSIQVDRTDPAVGDFQAYVKVGGVAVRDTNTQIIVNQNTQTINTCEFILNLVAGNVVEVGCWTNSVGQQALAVPISLTTPVAIPSIISNIYRLA